jgi:hypothetical protein
LYQQEMQRQNLAYTLLQGSPMQRLQQAWQAMLGPLAELLSESESETAADFIAGRRRAGVEGGGAGIETTGRANSLPSRGSLVFGAALQKRALGRWAIVPELMTWDFILFRATAARTSRFFSIPRHCLPAHVDRFFDPVLLAGLDACGDDDPPLTRLWQTAPPAIYPGADVPALLLELEAVARNSAQEEAPAATVAPGARLEKFNPKGSRDAVLAG